MMLFQEESGTLISWKNARDEVMIRRSWKRFLAGVALVGGLTLGNFASAGEVYNAGGVRLKTADEAGADEPGAAAAGADEGTTVEPPTLPPADSDGVPINEAPPADNEAAEAVGTETAATQAAVASQPVYYSQPMYYNNYYADDRDEIAFGGWLQMGYHNGVTPNSGGRNAGGSFNDHPHRLNLHQGWLYAESVADGSNGLDFGFRIDTMYGVDAGQTVAFGNTGGRWDFARNFRRGAGYGFAVPQAYAEMETGDLNIKVGHFYTIAGYETVTAPDNFFYSHALTMFNSEPFTHSGVLATVTASDSTTLYGGWTAGWDTGFDQFNNGSNFLGGFSVSLSEDITMTYIASAGEFGWRGNGYAHSIVIDTALTDNLNYVVQSDVTRTNDHDNSGLTPGKDNDVGLNQYLIYSLSDMVGVGTRFEWWKDEGKSQYAATVGVNIKPVESFILRPEIRHDWLLPGANRSETTFGIDAIIVF